MSFPACLRTVLSDKIKDSAEPLGSITLREKNVMVVELFDLAADTIAIRLDRIGLSGMANGPWKRCCDYLVICQAGDTVRALFVELKKTLSDSDPLEQLRRSLPWLKYLRSVCEIESGSEISEPEVHYAVIALKRHPRFDKQRVKQGGRPETLSHEDIQATLALGASRVQLRQLWGQ